MAVDTILSPIPELRASPATQIAALGLLLSDGNSSGQRGKQPKSQLPVTANENARPVVLAGRLELRC